MRSTLGPRAVIAIPTYCGSAFIESALSSLLDQTFHDVGFVVVDDASPDDTVKQVRRLAARDGRLTVEVNPRRLGMVANWNRAYHLALARAPEAEFFAWASDHDLWDPSWLERMVEALAERPQLVLAYPRVNRFFDDRNGLPGSGWRFETRGVANASLRLRMAAHGMVAGDMVYGVYRRSALGSGDIFPRVIYPDRLLLARLALVGEFVQADDVLWHRRMSAPSTPRRQRQTLFPGGPPLHSRLPWWLTHAAYLREAAGTACAASYAVAGLGVATRSVPARLRRQLGSTARRVAPVGRSARRWRAPR